jgi:hypothetical protein
MSTTDTRKEVDDAAPKQQGFETVCVTCEFERAVLDAKLVFNTDGRIQGLWFVPGKRPAPVAASPAAPPATVREKEIQIGEGDWILPGTLTLPVTAGPTAGPGLVLVHGSGPQDRDETIGGNKPFRDLAWGLGAKGVAVLRYEKRTKASPERFLKLGKLTVKEGSIDDALGAVARLRATEGIDTDRIFVLGHSLGGILAPRVAQADPSIAGLIILAGSTRPLEDLMVEQTRYLLSLDGGLSADDKAKLAELQAQVDKVKGLTASPSAPFLLGTPPSYWLDLRQYDAPATAKALKQPMLILQGGRDYQVTDADFEGWKRALGSRSDVRFKRYPNLNHLFMAGAGRSTPAEYEQTGHVAEEVIDDIAGWISPWGLTAGLAGCLGNMPTRPLKHTTTSDRASIAVWKATRCEQGSNAGPESRVRALTGVPLRATPVVAALNNLADGSDLRTTDSQV